MRCRGDKLLGNKRKNGTVFSLPGVYSLAMYRHEQVTATNMQSVLLPHVWSKGNYSLPTENYNPQQVRPKGDPASVHSGLYQVPAVIYERYTRATE